MENIRAGWLLRANAYECVVGCRVNQANTPAFGEMVCIPQEGDLSIYGLVYNLSIADDGLVRQLATSEGLDENTIRDNRDNRTVPLELSVLFLGYEQGEVVVHLMPPHPPLSLDSLLRCSDEEVMRFTSQGQFGYFRALLRNPDLPVDELLAAHLRQVVPIQRRCGHDDWAQDAARELIALLRDDYVRLSAVLSALADAGVYVQ